MPHFGIVVFSWFAGFLCADFCVNPLVRVALASAALGGGLLVAAAERLRHGWAWRCLLTGLAFAAGLSQRAEPAPPVPTGPARLEVKSVQPSNGHSTEVEVLSGQMLKDGKTLPEGTRLQANLRLPLFRRALVIGTLLPRHHFSNPSPHPSWHPGSRAPRLKVRYVKIRNLDSKPTPLTMIETLRGHVRQALDETLGGEVAGLAKTLVLGEKAATSYELRSSFRSVGMAHLLVVSGLHVGLVLSWIIRILLLVLRRMPWICARVDVSRWTSLLCACIAAPYALFAGGSPSAWRAAIMVGAACFLRALGRVAPPHNLLALAILVFGLWKPEQARGLSFLFSLLATSALLPSLGLHTDRKYPFFHQQLRLSARVVVLTLPLAVWSFGEVSVAGTVFNAVLTPIFTLALMPLVQLHAAIASALPWVGMATAALADWLGRNVLGLVALASTYAPLAKLPPPTVGQAGALAAACAALCFAPSMRVKLAALTAAAAVIVTLEVRLRVEQKPHHLRLTFLDVGQGDSTLIDLPDGRLMLVDAGGREPGGPDPGERVLAPLLRARRRTRIDIVVLSHPHPDHYGGLPAVADAFPIGELWTTRQALEEDRGGDAAALIMSLRKKGTRIVTPKQLCSGARRFGSVSTRVLWPCPAYDAGYDLNNNSLVVQLTNYGRRWLLVGDLEREGELEILCQGSNIKADVLKVGHHGSRTSTSPAFLKAVSPTCAVISSGRFNRYNHPHREVTTRLRRSGLRPLIIARLGGVVMDQRGANISVRSPALEAASIAAACRRRSGRRKPLPKLGAHP